MRPDPAMSPAPPAPPPAPTAVGLYLGGVQFLFACGWIVYAIYLPALAVQSGLPREAVPWLLLMDQLIFIGCDLAVGLWADRAARVLGRIGNWVLGATLLSAAAFLAVPWLAPAGSPALLVAVTVLWTASSSALRAPPLTLLGRHVARPALPWMASLMLLGTGIANALAPYLGMALAEVDPRGPFALSALALAAVSLGMVKAERALQAAACGPAPAAAAAAGSAPVAWAAAPVVVFLAAAGLAAAGAQLHANLLSAPLYLGHAAPAALPALLPVFWAGFNLALMPASLAARRFGELPVMVAGALFAGTASVVAGRAGSLSALIAAQALAGAGWGVALLAGFSAAVALGKGHRVGFMSGAFNAVLAGAAVGRIALVMTVAPAPALLAAGWGWVPGAMLMLAAGGLWALRGRSRAEPA